MLAGAALLCVQAAFSAQADMLMASHHPIPSTETNAIPKSIRLANLKKKNPLLLRKLKRAKRYWPIIKDIAQRHGVDAVLIKSIIMAESGFNPDAVSERGAQGLMQLMPTTAESLGAEDVFDPRVNIEAGVRYFSELLQKFDGRLELALAAYNAGSRNVRNYNGVPPFKATRAYIRKVYIYYYYYRELLNEEFSKA